LSQGATGNKQLAIGQYSTAKAKGNQEWAKGIGNGQLAICNLATSNWQILGQQKE
jgi:hypothetical protein